MIEKVNPEDRKAYAEVDFIIHNMNEKYINMLPKKMITFFQEVKDHDYKVEIDTKKPLYEQSLQNYTFDLLNILNLNYWCKDEEKKREILSMLSDSEAEPKFEEQMKSNLFTEIKDENKNNK